MEAVGRRSDQQKKNPKCAVSNQNTYHLIRLWIVQCIKSAIARRYYLWSTADTFLDAETASDEDVARRPSRLFLLCQGFFFTLRQ